MRENFCEGSHGAGSPSATSTTFSSKRPWNPRRSFSLLISFLLDLGGSDVDPRVRVEQGRGLRTPRDGEARRMAGLGGGADAGRALHGVDDVRIRAAAAEIAGDGVLDFFAGGLGIAVEERLAGHDHAGRAEAALERV